MRKTVVTGILAAALLLSAVPGAGAALTETPLTRGEFITCLYQADLDRQESGKVERAGPEPESVVGREDFFVSSLPAYRRKGIEGNGLSLYSASSKSWEQLLLYYDNWQSDKIFGSLVCRRGLSDKNEGFG